MIRTQGDVKIFILPGGIEIVYSGGQPVMDSGLENMVLIYLFTENGWPMNKILPLSQHIGSDFLTETRKPINITQLRKIEIAANEALKPIEANKIGTISDLSVKMITGSQIFLRFAVNPPGVNAIQIELSGYGNNWKMQRDEGGQIAPEKPSISRYLIDDESGILYDDGLRPLHE